jgi:hypothetical protein
MNGFNAYAPENTYSFDLAVQWLYRNHPSSVRICSTEPEIVKAAARRLSWIADGIIVENDAAAAAVEAILGVQPQVFTPGTQTDAALMPFSRHNYATPPEAATVVILAHNAFSYKSLLRPGQIEDQVFSLLRWLRKTHRITGRAGLFTPNFLFYWILSLLAAHRVPTLHFRSGQRALDRILDRHLLWYTGYIVVIAGERR